MLGDLGVAKKINPVRRDRLIQLMDETGVGQNELYRRSGVAQQNIWKVVHSELNLSDSAAESIISAFPKYRIQWLLGYDDYKTEADLLAHYFDKQKEQSNKERALFCLVADLGKWNVYPSSVVGGAEYDPDNEAMSETNFFTWEFDNYAKIRKGKTAVDLNKSKFERLVSKTVDYFNFELAHMD